MLECSGSINFRCFTAHFSTPSFGCCSYNSLGNSPSLPTLKKLPQTQPRYKVTIAQLQTALAQRFLLREPVSGLVNLDLQVPQLRRLPDQNRLSAAMTVNAVGPAQQRSYHGTLEVEFALRYEASDARCARQLSMKHPHSPYAAAGQHHGD